jgi:hypothetical protein
MSSLNEFFKQEQKRFFQPDQYFSRRVMTRLKAESASQAGLWDSILSASRPVAAVALTLVLMLLGVRMFLPVEPNRSMIEAYFSSEVSPGESLLYTDSDAPSHDQLEQVMVLENEL